MKILIKNGKLINVFTGEIEQTNILLDGSRIIGVGAYNGQDADMVVDATGKYVAPGFIDGHIHIESTMLSPRELSKVCMLHGTTSIVADPHEIANVCGRDGIRYMIEESKDIPLNVFIMLPSCVPATGFDESGAVLDAKELEGFYDEPCVLGFGEMMNYPGVINDNAEVLKKLNSAKAKGLTINGHAPLLSGRELDKYISAGIRDDHECSNVEEAKERIRKGQWVMIREGSFAKNLVDLIELFEEPFAHRCILVSDDKHPADILKLGHVDHMLRLAAKHGKSVIRAIQMATIQAADCIGIKDRGAIAPGYVADIVIFDNLDEIRVSDVFIDGKRVVENGSLVECDNAGTAAINNSAVHLIGSVHIKELSASDFYIASGKKSCRVIQTIPDQLITNEEIIEVDFDVNGGIDVDKDILKIAVAERYHNTGHIGLGLIKGIGIKRGAIASTVAHDSHNLVIVGTNDKDMAVAGNYIRKIGGGYVAVADGEILGCVPLEIGGLMSTKSAVEVADELDRLKQAMAVMGVEKGNPFTSIAFVCLPVIPKLKITTKGLVDVDKQELVGILV